MKSLAFYINTYCHDFGGLLTRLEQRAFSTHVQYVALLTSKIQYLIFPNPTPKTKMGMAKGRRLLIATRIWTNQTI
jgi:hypothetical protein